MTVRSAGLGLSDEAYEYGRRHSHLDFCAVTDGDRADSYLADEEWEDVKKVVRKHHKPGSFVTFLAYECHERRFGGDKNVYYLDDEAPLISWSDLPEPGEPTQLWKALKGRKAITVCIATTVCKPLTIPGSTTRKEGRFRVGFEKFLQMTVRPLLRTLNSRREEPIKNCLICVLI